MPSPETAATCWRWPRRTAFRCCSGHRDVAKLFAQLAAHSRLHLEAAKAIAVAAWVR
jgi:hypothetical protein